uniref:Uncharacterized protein n=1 Tax=Rhizophora mucronata TaxID=61149 RepID=A0A2P2MNY9_RHIMU
MNETKRNIEKSQFPAQCVIMVHVFPPGRSFLPSHFLCSLGLCLCWWGAVGHIDYCNLLILCSYLQNQSVNVICCTIHIQVN